MSKVFVVFGATGTQGGSVINHVLSTPSLASKFSIRAITRSTTSKAAQALASKGVTLATADLDDATTLGPAVEGAHAVFLSTISVYDDKIRTREVAQGKNVADAAVAAGVEQFIFSSLVNTAPDRGPDSPLQHMDHFDGKAEVEAYIRTLPIKSAFFAPGCFMQNFHENQMPRAISEDKKTFGLFNWVSPSTPVPLIETAADTGTYITPALLDPEKYNGAFFASSTEVRTYEEIAEIMTKSTGGEKTVVYKQLPREVMEGFMPAPMGKYICDMFGWFEAVGYYGPETEKKVEWTKEQVEGSGEKLTTFEEYLQKHPLILE